MASDFPNPSERLVEDWLDEMPSRYQVSANYIRDVYPMCLAGDVTLVQSLIDIISSLMKVTAEHYPAPPVSRNAIRSLRSDSELSSILNEKPSMARFLLIACQREYELTAVDVVPKSGLFPYPLSFRH